MEKKSVWLALVAPSLLTMFIIHSSTTEALADETVELESKQAVADPVEFEAESSKEEKKEEMKEDNEKIEKIDKIEKKEPLTIKEEIELKAPPVEEGAQADKKVDSLQQVEKTGQAGDADAITPKVGEAEKDAKKPLEDSEKNKLSDLEKSKAVETNKDQTEKSEKEEQEKASAAVKSIKDPLEPESPVKEKAQKTEANQASVEKTEEKELSQRDKKTVAEPLKDAPASEGSADKKVEETEKAKVETKESATEEVGSLPVQKSSAQEKVQGAEEDKTQTQKLSKKEDLVLEENPAPEPAQNSLGTKNLPNAEDSRDAGALSEGIEDHSDDKKKRK